jgi:hypothetical protein
MMNDFTKEELKLFLDYEQEANGQSPLHDKLQSMIDNYCDNGECHHGVKAVNCFVCHQEELTLEDREALLKVPNEES